MLIRLWFVLSVLWVGFFTLMHNLWGFVDEAIVPLFFGPPLAVLVLGGALYWAVWGHRNGQ